MGEPEHPTDSSQLNEPSGEATLDLGDISSTEMEKLTQLLRKKDVDVTFLTGVEFESCPTEQQEDNVREVIDNANRIFDKPTTGDLSNLPPLPNPTLNDKK